MQFKKGAEVISSEGEKIGTLDRDEDDPEEVDIYYCYPPAMGWDVTGRYFPFLEPVYIGETEKNISEGMIALKEGAMVFTSDGEQVSSIEQGLRTKTMNT